MNAPIAGIETGAYLASLFHDTLQRLGRQSANCKLGTALGLGIVLMLALQGGTSQILWAAAPLALLALADAGYTAQARRIAEFGRKLNGQKDAVRPGDLMQLQASAWGFQGVLGGLAGFLSFTVWPFYVCLAGLAIGLGSTIAKPSIPVPAPMVRTPTGYAQQGMPLNSPSGLSSKLGRPTLPGAKSLTPHLQANPGAVPAKSGPQLPPSNTAMPHGPSSAPKILPLPVPQSVSRVAPSTPVSGPITGATPPSAASPASAPAAVPPPSPSAPTPPPSPAQATSPPAGSAK